MIRPLILAWARLIALTSTARSAVCLSRILLIIISVEVITMPFTQGLWSWDKFLHGGQDFELGLLIIITCLCFVLLRVQQSERCHKLFVLIRSLLNDRRCSAANLVMRGNPFAHRSQIPPQLSSAAFNLPLQI